MASLVKARARRIRRRAHLEEFVVLVWGPGDPGPGADADALLAYRKRLEIRQNLEREFPEAEVVFSEDAAMAQAAAPTRHPLRQETIHASIADVIVILDVSRGADVEIDHFVMNVPGIRDRLFVLLPAEHADSNGLANRVLDRLDRETQVREFTQNQLEDSVVASQMAVECALEIVMERAARAEAWLRV